jgi:hypothetical protein
MANDIKGVTPLGEVYEPSTDQQLQNLTFSIKIAYIVTKLQYYDDWIKREIDKRLLPLPFSRKSIKVAGALKA